MKILLISLLLVLILRKLFKNYIENDVQEQINWIMNKGTFASMMYYMSSIFSLILFVIISIKLIIKIF